MPVHPDLARMLADTPADAQLDMPAFPVDVAVRRIRARAVPAITVPGAVPIEDIRVPGGDGERPARVYRPASPRGVLLHLHGGGWTMGSIEQDDYYCQLLARDAGCVVVSLDYRLAPEHPFPQPLDDCWAAMRWVSANAARLAGGSAKIAVGGISAGANLAAAVALRARDEAGPPIAMQVLMYPVCDGGLDFPSYATNAEGYHLTTAAMRWFWDRYAPGTQQRLHPLASVLRAPSHAGLPPAVVMTCEYDPLRDEGNAYAERLKAAGVPVTHRELPGMIHGFLRRGWDRPWAQEPVAQVAAALKRALGAAPA